MKELVGILSNVEYQNIYDAASEFESEFYDYVLNIFIDKTKFSNETVSVVSSLKEKFKNLRVIANVSCIYPGKKFGQRKKR